MNTAAPQSTSRWPHRLAVVVMCATLPLISVGGLVTTYEAGMAVIDWPTTYGYNLFLYPISTWLAGPWDLFIEHGHRLLAALVAFGTAVLAVTIVRCDGRRWMRWFAVAAFAGVMIQAALGGMRVVLDERLLAKIHACVGPAFFAVIASIAVMTSRRWLEGSPPALHPQAGTIQRLAIMTTVLAFMQLLLGAQVRHVMPGIDPSAFRGLVLFHLVMAAVLAVHVFLLVVRVVRHRLELPSVVIPAVALGVLFVVQIALGVATWVVNYGWPTWFAAFGWAQGFVVEQESMLQANVTTAHVATGSLILAVSTATTLLCFRAIRSPAASSPAISRMVWGVAL